MTLRFQDRVAIVTGGCKGIGRSCVDILVENGGRVVVFDINDTTGQQMKSEGPGQVLYRHCDMTNEGHIEKSIEETVTMFGKIDCLINNARMRPTARMVDELSSGDFRNLIDVNLMACFLACKFALPYIRRSGGSIINVNNTANITGQMDSVIYSATTGGVSALTRALATEEMKNGVRVNIITPDGINTPVFKEWEKTITDKERESIKEIHAQLGRHVDDPREIGRACLYLAVDVKFTAGVGTHCAETTAPGPSIVHVEGNMCRKHDMEGPTKKAIDRQWDKVYVVIDGHSLSCYKDQKHAKQDQNSRIHHEAAFDLTDAEGGPATDYKKYPNVFRLRLATGGEYLFLANNQSEMKLWMGVIKGTHSAPT